MLIRLRATAMVLDRLTFDALRSLRLGGSTHHAFQVQALPSATARNQPVQNE